MQKYDFDTIHNRKGTGCFKADALQMMYGREDLLPLWVADMEFAAAPEIRQAMADRLRHPVFGYNLRLPAYYESIINWISRRYGWQIKKEWIINTPGIVTAVNIAVLTHTRPGDSIVIQTPVYDPFYEAVRSHERKLLTNPLKLVNGRYEIDFADLEQKLAQSTMFILCSPHNPVGRVWTQEELMQIGFLCRRYNVTVVSDEIHADIVFDGRKHIPFANLDDFAEFTISCYSPGKSFNLAGLCTSAIVIPNQEIRQSFADYVQSMHLFLGNTFGITALQAAYSQGENWLDALLKYLEKNRDYLCSFFTENLPQFNVIKPEGTYLAWVDFGSLDKTDDELKDILVKQAGLAISMGRAYGEEGKGFVRINFACPFSILSQACDRLKDTFGKG